MLIASREYTHYCYVLCDAAKTRWFVSCIILVVLKMQGCGGVRRFSIIL